jgi:hypothetical protein
MVILNMLKNINVCIFGFLNLLQINFKKVCLFFIFFFLVLFFGEDFIFFLDFLNSQYVLTTGEFQIKIIGEV